MSFFVEAFQKKNEHKIQNILNFPKFIAFKDLNYALEFLFSDRVAWHKDRIVNLH